MAGRILTGIPVSSGIAIGKALFVNRDLHEQIPRQTITPQRIFHEIARLDEAIQQAVNELEQVRTQVPAEFQDHGLIIDSHIAILKDPKLTHIAHNYLEKLHINAEWALLKAVSNLEEAFAAITDSYIRERIQDVRLVADRILSKLLGMEQDLSAIQGRFILMARDLAPSDTAGLEPSKIMALTTVEGGKTSHTGILARSLQIPAVVGVENLESTIEDGQSVIIDAFKGRILVEPEEHELAQYKDLQEKHRQYSKDILLDCHQPAMTADKTRITVMTNIELFDDVAALLDYGGEGIGLYRTEYSYMNRRTMPQEEELYEEYRSIVSVMGSRSVTFRTFDLGADKMPSTSSSLIESNPAMGFRSIRFCLRHQDMFKTQLRALLRAAHTGNVQIMYPMISGLEELQDANAVLDKAREELTREGIPFAADVPVGIMVELPATVMVAEQFARQVDFFSIGTNDLLQYVLGVDRTNKDVASLYQPLHPALLLSIQKVVTCAHEAGIAVSLCGEMASDPFCVPLLAGMHLDILSMTPQTVPGIKRILGQITTKECEELVEECLRCLTVREINRIVRRSIFHRFPEELMFYSSFVGTEDI